MRSRARCKVARSGRSTQITVSGRLDSRSQRRLLDEVWRAAERRDLEVVVDLSGLTYFDSVALSTLVGLERVVEHQCGCAVDVRGLEHATYLLTGLRPAAA